MEIRYIEDGPKKEKRLIHRTVFLAIALCAPAALAQRATVKVESATIYKHPRVSEDEIIGTLKSGTPINIIFAARSAKSEWCEVCELAGTFHGYMDCAQLARGAADPQYVEVTNPRPLDEYGSPVQRELSTPVVPAIAATNPPPGEEWHQVRYAVEGGGLAFLTYRNASGGTEQMTVDLPWKLKFQAVTGDFLYVSAQKQPIRRRRECETESILRPDSCFAYDRLLQQSFLPVKATIFLDERTLQTAQSGGPYGIATVSGTIK